MLINHGWALMDPSVRWGDGQAGIGCLNPRPSTLDP
jgi:hypothetical protein